MIELGSEYKDSVTGFQGIAVARHTYLNGCDRISLQPKVKDDGTMAATATFDAPQLVLVTPDVVAEGSKSVGGPEKYADSGRVVA